MTRVFVAKDGDNKPQGWVDASLGMVVVSRLPNKRNELDIQNNLLLKIESPHRRVDDGGFPPPEPV